MIVLDACTKYQNLQMIRGPRDPVWPKTWRSEPHAATLQTTIGTAAATLSRPKRNLFNVLFIIVCAVLHLWLARMTGQAICRCLCASFNSIAAPWLEIRCYDAPLKHGNILVSGFGTVVPGKSCEVFVFSLLDRKWNRRDTKLRRGFLP